MLLAPRSRYTRLRPRIPRCPPFLPQTCKRLCLGSPRRAGNHRHPRLCRLTVLRLQCNLVRRPKYTYKNCNSGYARIYKNRVTSYYKEAPGPNGFTTVPENPVAPQTTVTMSNNFRFQIAFLPGTIDYFTSQNANWVYSGVQRNQTINGGWPGIFLLSPGLVQ